MSSAGVPLLLLLTVVSSNTRSALLESDGGRASLLPILSTMLSVVQPGPAVDPGPVARQLANERRNEYVDDLVESGRMPRVRAARPTSGPVGRSAPPPTPAEIAAMKERRERKVAESARKLALDEERKKQKELAMALQESKLRAKNLEGDDGEGRRRRR
jgi:hypothetical protein